MNNKSVLVSGLGRFMMLAVCALPSAVGAQTYDFDINSVGRAEALEQPYPVYPEDAARRQEGWVRMSFIVTPEGRATDPIVLDSSGGYAFEREARNALSNWRFEATETGSTWNLVDVRSRLRRSKDKSTTRFGRATGSVGQHIESGEVEKAREKVDAAVAKGGWNLYESTILWLMAGRVAGLEGNDIDKLENYQRALAMGNSRSIPAANRRVVLEWIFGLQAQLGQFAAARSTHSRLQNMEDNDASLARTADRLAQVQAILDSGEPIAATATIKNPCDCDDGEPLWHYVPARRTFSFANLDGNVERFEARCENGRMQDQVSEGQTWLLEPELGVCRIFVFGDDKATFNLIEHGDNQDT